MALSATTDVKVVRDSPRTRGSQEAEAEKVDENATKKSRALTKRKGAERRPIRRRNIDAKSDEVKSKGTRASWIHVLQ